MLKLSDISVPEPIPTFPPHASSCFDKLSETVGIYKKAFHWRALGPSVAFGSLTTVKHKQFKQFKATAAVATRSFLGHKRASEEWKDGWSINSTCPQDMTPPMTGFEQSWWGTRRWVTSLHKFKSEPCRVQHKLDKSLEVAKLQSSRSKLRDRAKSRRSASAAAPLASWGKMNVTGPRAFTSKHLQCKNSRLHSSKVVYRINQSIHRSINQSSYESISHQSVNQSVVLTKTYGPCTWLKSAPCLTISQGLKEKPLESCHCMGLASVPKCLHYLRVS